MEEEYFEYIIVQTIKFKPYLVITRDGYLAPNFLPRRILEQFAS